MNTANILVEILCHHCGIPTEKKLNYLLRRVRENKTLFFCSRKCSDKHHSVSMTGEGNPNFNGSWQGPPVETLFTKEQLRQQGIKSISKMKSDGSYEQRMNKLNEGHKKYFSTDEGIAKRKEIGVIGAIACSKNNKGTSIEIKMRDELASRGIEYTEQYNLGNKFALDFFLPEYNIVIECDGDYWHRLPKTVTRDKAKNAYIKACGFSLYRFWESEINRDVEACVDLVLAEINALGVI